MSLAAFTAIPEVDLRRWHGDDADRAALAAEVREICHEIGFFQLVGHGVPDDFRARYFDLLQRFFALPEDVKAQIDKVRSPHFRGWERVGAELTDNKTDYREQLDVSTENPPYPADALPPYLRLDGPNQWLPDDVLPGFRAAVGELFDALQRRRLRADGGAVGRARPRARPPPRRVRRAPAVAHQADQLPADPTRRGRRQRPPRHRVPDPADAARRRRAAGPQPGRRWIDVPPRDDAFVVNLGEMLQRMTGNYFVATTHRVVATEARVSSGYFHGPDLRTPLDPLPLAAELAAAVAASPRHAGAGFMAKRSELLAGQGGTSSTSADVYGQQLWNYYLRSYPDNVRAHYPDLAE